MQPRQKNGRGAAKVNTSNGSLWHHVSRLNGAVKIRRSGEGNVFEEKRILIS